MVKTTGCLLVGNMVKTAGKPALVPTPVVASTACCSWERTGEASRIGKERYQRWEAEQMLRGSMTTRGWWKGAHSRVACGGIDTVGLTSGELLLRRKVNFRPAFCLNPSRGCRSWETCVLSAVCVESLARFSCPPYCRDVTGRNSIILKHFPHQHFYYSRDQHYPAYVTSSSISPRSEPMLSVL